MNLISGLSVCLIFTFAGCGPESPYERHSSEEVLLKIFREERATFERMLSLLKADRRLARVYANKPLPDISTVSREYLAGFQRSLIEIGCVKCSFEGVGEVAFNPSLSGWGVSGSSQGYMHMKRAPSDLRKSLDGPKTPRQMERGVFRHIEGDWYLFFQS